MQTILFFFIFYRKKIFVPYSDEIEVCMVNNNKASQIAKYAVVFAIIFIAMLIDKAISFIPVGFSMAACVLLVTLTFCFLDNSWMSAFLSGLFFGIASFLKEFFLPSGILGSALPVQYWLMVTIPPRVLMTTLAFGTYRILQRLTVGTGNTKKRQIVCLVCSAFVGLAVNTLAFVSSLELARYIYNLLHGFTQGTENKGVFVMIYGLLVTNIIPEYLISMVCVSPLVLGVRRGLKLGVDGNNRKRDEVSMANDDGQQKDDTYTDFADNNSQNDNVTTDENN